jgi:hypothetical protein
MDAAGGDGLEGMTAGHGDGVRAARPRFGIGKGFISRKVGAAIDDRIRTELVVRVIAPAIGDASRRESAGVVRTDGKRCECTPAGEQDRMVGARRRAAVWKRAAVGR